MNLKAAIVVLGLLVTGACSRKQEAATDRPPAVHGASIEKVALAPVEDSYEATGTVRARTTSVLSSKIVGSVVAVRVHEGDRVRAGQVVIEIDNREAATQVQKAQAGQREAQEGVEEIDRSIRAAEAARTAAEANRTLAAATFERYKTLLERHSVSQQEFEEVQARDRVAKAEVDRATKMLQSQEARRNQVLARIDQAKAEVGGAQVYAGYARIASPINGVVTAKSADVGFMAAPGAPLITIEDDTRYRLEVAVEESRLASIRMGSEVPVTIDALGGGELTGRVAELVPAADPASRTYIVKIDLPDGGHVNGQHLLRSGLYGKARFRLGEKQATTVPQKAIVERGQLSGVFVVDTEGVARLRLIKTGKTFGDRVEVLSGLSAGDRIVVDRVEAVNDGSKVD